MKNHAAQTVKVHLRISSAFAKRVNRASLKRAAQSAFKSVGRGCSGELTIVIADDDQVRELNRIYRGVDASTDVLAFHSAGGAEGFISPPVEPVYLGDIVISYPRAVEQAAMYGHSVEEELTLLTVHGVLHLFGYNHERTEDKEEMWRVQSAALAKLGIYWQP